MIATQTTYPEISLSKTALKNASADANKLLREWASSGLALDELEEWLIEGARECADDRYSFDDDHYDHHMRYREEIEYLFRKRVQGSKPET